MNTTKIVPVPRGVVSASRRGYILTAAVLLAVMAGGTLPVPLYVLYEQQMGFGPLGVTVVFAAYVAQPASGGAGRVSVAAGGELARGASD